MSSKLSGPFNESHEEIACETLEMIMQFLHRPSAWTKVRKLEKNQGASWATPEPARGLVSDSRRRLESTSDPVSVQTAGSTVLAVPNHEHQELLRAMDFHSLVAQCLKINYNIAFEGSICTQLEKIQSREKHVKVLRAALKCVGMFVTGNTENQHLLAEQLPLLRNLIGPLKMPKLTEADLQLMARENVSIDRIPQLPTLGVEELTIEIVKGNPALCSQVLKRDLFNEFGKLLDEHDDPSHSQLLRFFETACYPRDAVTHNQLFTIEIFLSDALPRVRSCIDRLIDGVVEVGNRDVEEDAAPSSTLSLSSKGSFKPWRILKVLCSALEGRNAITASKLAQSGLSIDILVTNLVDFLDAKLSDGMVHESDSLMEEFLNSDAEDYHAVMNTAVEMMHVLSLELQVLALNQRLFDDSKLWRLVKYIHRFVVAFAKSEEVRVLKHEISTFILNGK